MASALPRSTLSDRVRLVPVDPKVKSAKTCKMSLRGMRGFIRSPKNADPSCYNSVTVKGRTGLFDIVEMDMEHAFKRGDRVSIFNSTLGGRPIFEGYAKVLRRLDTDHYYRVKFTKNQSGCDDGEYDRFVFAGEQQDDVDGYLTRQQDEWRKRCQPQYGK